MTVSEPVKFDHLGWRLVAHLFAQTPQWAILLQWQPWLEISV